MTNAQISATSFSFNAIGQSGTYWSIYESTDLTNWGMFTGMRLDSSGNGSFSDATVTNIPYRFYKLSDGVCCSQAIGFYRVQVGAGTTNSPGTNGLVALQLDSPVANTLDGLFNVNGTGMPDGTPLPDGSVVIKWDDASQVLNNYTWTSTTGWRDSSGKPAGSLVWNVGESAYVAVSNATTLTFVGAVKEGTLSMFLPGNGGVAHLVGATIPKAGGLQSVLRYTPQGGDEIWLWTGSGLVDNEYFLRGGGQWNPQEPILNVGQGFFWRGVTNTWQTQVCGAVPM